MNNVCNFFFFSTKSKKHHIFFQSKTVQIFSPTYSVTGTGLFGVFKSLNDGRIMKQIARPYNTLEEANKNAAKVMFPNGRTWTDRVGQSWTVDVQ